MVAEVILSTGLVALVDDADLPLVSPFRWFPKQSGKAIYARGCIGGYNGKRCRLMVKMHILLMGHRPGFVIDHENGNGLDNRRCNLRWATQSQNIGNTHSRRSASGLKGVRLEKRTGKWTARIKYQFRELHLGTFVTVEEAIAVYDAAAVAIWGEFANLNRPEKRFDPRDFIARWQPVLAWIDTFPAQETTR